jgi:hypothetical protein
MGIFKKFGDFASKTAKAATETFISPIARELIRPAVTMRAGIDGLVKGGRTGEESVQTPFGEVKPLGNLQSQARGRSLEEQNSVRGGQAVGGAAELALAVPGLAEKAVGKLAAPIIKSKPVQALGRGIKGLAVETMERALSPTKDKMKILAKRVAPQMLEEKIAGTLKSIGKQAKEGLKNAAEELDEFGAIEGFTDSKKVLSVLEEAKRSFVTPRGVVVDAKPLKIIDNLSQVIRDAADEGGQIAREELRSIRQIWDKAVYAGEKTLGKTVEEGTELSLKKMATDSIRNLLAEEVPDLAKINKKFNFYSNLLKLAEATGARRTGQSGLVRRGFGALLGSQFGKVASNVTGIPGGEIAGAAAGSEMAKITGSTLFKSLSAKGKNMVADAILQGDKSLAKIAGYFGRAGFASLKLKDLGNFLKDEATMDDAEIEALETAHNAEVDELRNIFDTADTPVEGQPELSPEENQVKVDELRAMFGR